MNRLDTDCLAEANQREIEKRLDRSSHNASAAVAGTASLTHAGATDTAVIAPKGKGRVPRTWRQARIQLRFDRQHWPGALAEWARDRDVLPYRLLAEKFGLKSRQRAHQIDRDIFPGIPKPHVYLAPPRAWRPDITRERVREVAARHPTKTAIANELGIGVETLRKCAERFDIALPKLRRLYPLTRPDITREKFMACRERCRNVTEMARQLATTPVTIYRRAERYGVTLPSSRNPIKRRRIALCKRIIELRGMGRKRGVIAATLGVSACQIQYYSRTYKLTSQTPILA